MRRFPYIEDETVQSSELIDTIRARRGGTLLNLDRMLLHSPELARGWNAHLGSVRSRFGVPPKLRELAICGVAVLNDADYELAQHLPLFLIEGGSPEAAEALKSFDSACLDAALFNAVERATLRLTGEMTRRVRVSDDTFERIRSELGNDRHLVELVAIVATYNMVSRFLVALGVDSEGEGSPPNVAAS
jgi:alkylhydroperoxidase family enzyme